MYNFPFHAHRVYCTGVYIINTSLFINLSHPSPKKKKKTKRNNRKTHLYSCLSKISLYFNYGSPLKSFCQQSTMSCLYELWSKGGEKKKVQNYSLRSSKNWEQQGPNVPYLIPNVIYACSVLTSSNAILFYTFYFSFFNFVCRDFKLWIFIWNLKKASWFMTQKPRQMRFASILKK